jgi:hypothetical protein
MKISSYALGVAVLCGAPALASAAAFTALADKAAAGKSSVLLVRRGDTSQFIVLRPAAQ